MKNATVHPHIDEVFDAITKTPWEYQNIKATKKFIDMRRLNFHTLQYYWDKVTEDPVKEPFLDPRSRYHEWSDSFGTKYYGMRIPPPNKKNGKAIDHGYQRYYAKNGGVYEACQKDGQFHGLRREVSENDILYSLY